MGKPDLDLEVRKGIPEETQMNPAGSELNEKEESKVNFNGSRRQGAGPVDHAAQSGHIITTAVGRRSILAAHGPINVHFTQVTWMLYEVLVLKDIR